MRHLRVIPWVAAVLVSTATAALANDGVPHGLAWSWEPGVLTPLAVAAAWYGRGIASLRRAGRVEQVAGRLRIVLFVAALTIVLLALESPLDALSDKLFSAHMIQHLLLSLVAAPLFACSRQGPVFLWGLSPRWRHGLLRSWRRGRLGAVGRALLHPVVVWTAFCATFVFWHIPGPYRWALDNPLLHALEHLCFLVAPLAFWTLVFDSSPRRRMDHGATLIFIVTAAILSDLPGALMLLAPRPLFAASAAEAASWGLTRLQDQELAGAIMWVPMGFLFVAAGAWVFARWMEAAGRPKVRLPGRGQAASAIALLVIVPGVLLVSARTDVAAAPLPRINGDSNRGAELIGRFGCGYCHAIPGIANANGRVGPPLSGFGDRLYVAGMLPNTPENLMEWIENPQRIVPGNVMPVLGISDHDARDIATYLYTLH